MSEREEVTVFGARYVKDADGWFLQPKGANWRVDMGRDVGLILRALLTAERERDEARRERDGLREEMQHDDTIINGQAALLTGVVNAIRGEPSPLSMHSHHDVVELVQELVKVRYQRKPLPESGGYVCDANGVIDTNTIATMREVSYLHDEAVSAVASLIRSHEALRHRAERAERVVEAAEAYEQWQGKWYDYTLSQGEKPAKQQRAIIKAVRALRAVRGGGQG